jgi:hypothetical protein
VGGSPDVEYSCDGAPLASVGTDFLFVVDTSKSWNAHADRYAGLARAVGEFLDDHAETHEFGALMFPRFDDTGESGRARGPLPRRRERDRGFCEVTVFEGRDEGQPEMRACAAN